MIFRKGNIILGVAFLCLFFLISRLASASTIPEYQVDEGNSLGVDMTTFLPIIFNRYENSISPIGVQMYGATGDTSQYHSSLLASGTSWVRAETSWANVEPVRTSQPTYNWSSADNAFAAARPDMGGLNIIATIRFPPDWAADGPELPIYLDRYDEFAQFVSALVERFDGDGVSDAPGSPVVVYWEIFNEPDRFNYWGHSGEEFANLLKVVYPALKSANLNAQLVFPGIAYDWFEDQNGPFTRSFLTDVLDNGGGAYFDVMNFHSYPIFYTNWTTNQGTGLLEKGQYIQNILADYDLIKPIVVTETGWHSNNVASAIPGSPEIQANYVIQLMTQGHALDAKIVVWWMYYDAGGVYQYENGLVTNSNPPVPKLAYSIFQDVAETLGTAHFVRKLTIAETSILELEAYEFNDNIKNQRLFVAWLNPVTATGTQPLKLPVAQAIVRNPISGTQYTILDASDGKIDGYITVQVGARPIYVEVGK